MYPISLYALVLIAIQHAPLVQGATRMCAIRQCDKCLDPSLQSAPGVGFHLGLIAGTAAFSDSNGHVENIIHIPGSLEYVALMQVFTTRPNRLQPPLLDTLSQKLHFLRKKFERHANLLLGRPSTPNAATLSSMLTSLRSETESRLSVPITTVGIALPNAALESLEEVNDALSYSSLNKLGEWQIPDRELNSAYAAFGYGLCSSYTDPYKCEEEEEVFGLGERILHLDYTNKTLAANTGRISSARETYTETTFADWKLGRDEASQWEKESDYWDAVKSRIRDLAATSKLPYTQLLLTGERAADENFLDVLKDAFRGSNLGYQVEARRKEMDLTFVVARGAAELQRRRQQGWLGCMQPMHCSESAFLEKATTKAKQTRVLEL